MIFIADVPVAMTDLSKIHRADVEKVYARKSSLEDAQIIDQSMEANQKIKVDPKAQVSSQVGKVGRTRRHSSYEPNLDDILEEENDNPERDLAAIHRERALNAGVVKRNDSGRSWRKYRYLNNNTRPRAYTAWTRRTIWNISPKCCGYIRFVLRHV